MQGVPSEVHNYLHSFECVPLQVVVTAPDSQFFNLLSVNGLVSLVDEADDGSVIYKFQKLYRGVFCSALIFLYRERSSGVRTHP